jgi:phosphatidylglycerol:prolipoprotein diacylglycerol transferase
MYFFVISLVTTLSALWFVRRAEQKQLAKVKAIDLALVILVFGFLGARLLHVFFEDPWLYKQFPWASLQVWNGGFVYFGGVIGALIASVAFCQLQKEPFWFWADIAAPPIALGYAFGRVACFLNGCCYGRVCELPWSMHLHGLDRHPTQLYATFVELVLVGFLLWVEPRLRASGHLFLVWLLGHGLGRLFMESFRDDPRGHLIYGWTIGVWISVGLIAFSAWNLKGYLIPRENLQS